MNGPRNLALSGPYHSMAARVTCLLPCDTMRREQWINKGATAAYAVHSCDVLQGSAALTLPAGTGARMVWPRKDLDMTVCMLTECCERGYDPSVQTENERLSRGSGLPLYPGFSRVR